MIREAHEGPDNQSSPTEDATPFTMDSSFFLGEDEGQQDEEDCYPPKPEEDEGVNSSHSDDDSGHGSQGSSTESNRSTNSETDEPYHPDSDAPF